MKTVIIDSNSLRIEVIDEVWGTHSFNCLHKLLTSGLFS